MNAPNPEQCRGEVPSLTHADPDLCAIDNSCADSSNGISISVAQISYLRRQCLEIESKNGVSPSVFSSHYDLIYETIEGLENLECSKPKRRSSAKRKWSLRGRHDDCGGRQVCYCAVSFAADCAAICCCPCALLHLFILTLVKVPFVFTRKAFRYVMRKTWSNRQSDHKKNDEDDNKGDDRTGKSPSFSPVWSCRESPQTSGPLDRSLDLNLGTHKLWMELYAAGHMGFGGIPL